MANLLNLREGPWSAPSRDLWGREVYDSKGRHIGTVDSIARTYHGGARAIVRTRARGPRRFVFINLDEAEFDGDALIVPASSLPSPDNESGAGARPRIAWPVGLRRPRLHLW
jgi:PRC-barrel domain